MNYLKIHGLVLKIVNVIKYVKQEVTMFVEHLKNNAVNQTAKLNYWILIHTVKIKILFKI